MKNQILEEAFSLIDKLFLKYPNKFWKNKDLYPSDIDIKRMEKTLNSKLPRDYIDFMRKYGSLSFWSTEIYGFDDNPRITLEYRKWDDPKAPEYFPGHLVIIYSLGEGSEYCIDVKNNNCIVVWDGNTWGEEPEYECSCFTEFLLSKLLCQLERKKASQEYIDECKSLLENYKVKER